MPRNGSGIYTLPQPAFTAGTVISSAAMNSDLSDIATALTGSLPRDGQAGMTGQMLSIDGGVSTPGYAFSTEKTTGFTHSTGIIGVSITGVNVGQFDSTGWNGTVNSVIGANGAVPIGSLLDFAGSTAPAKWILCYGQLISRTTYAALFAVLGTTYGAGDGTTFGLPDLRGRLVYGLDNMGGSPAGRLTTTYFGSNPTVLGDGGGSQNYTQLQSDLPNIAPTFTGTLATISVTSNNGPYLKSNSPIGAQSGSGAIAGQSGNSAFQEVTASGSYTPQGTVQSLNGGVAQTLMKTVSPGLVLNKIIFAGA